MLLLVMLTGCSQTQNRIERAMALRTKLLGAECAFAVCITADYGNTVYTFRMDCTGDVQGNMVFTVTEPETIAGIGGTLTGEGGNLTFEEAALGFDLLADGQVSPVSAPWLLLKTLRSGYLTSAGEDGELLRVTIDSSYEEDALQVDVWLDDQNLPVCAEIAYGGRRILTLEIEDFQIR